MKYNIYLCQYNNYYNRIVKKLDSINDYINADAKINTVENCNFEIGDGITTSIIINYNYVLNQPDYILAEDIASRVVDNLGNLVSSTFSRWFVIDSHLIRGNQFKFNLRRDICADFNTLLLNSTYFLERGYVEPTNDLIFNNEEQNYSEIKTTQTELRDETYGPWIVGYIPRIIGSGITPSADGYLIKGIATPGTEDIPSTDITQEWWYKYTNKATTQQFINSTSGIALPLTLTAFIPAYHPAGSGAYYYRNFYEIDLVNKQATSDPLYRPGHTYRPNGVVYPYLGDLYPEDAWTVLTTGVIVKEVNQSSYNTAKSNLGWYFQSQLNAYNGIQVNTAQYLNKWLSNMNNNALAYSQMMSKIYTDLDISNAEVSDLESLNGKSVLDQATGKKYTILLNKEEIMEKGTIDSTLNTRIRFLMPQDVTTQFGTMTRHTDDSTVKNDNLQLVYHLYKYSLTLQEQYGVQTYIPKNDASNGTIYRQHLTDAPYDMFAIPYTDQLTIINGNNTLVPNVKAAMAIASSVITTLGDGNVYDIQILPYCPVRNFIQTNHTFDISAANSTQVQPIVDSANTETILNYIFFCNTSTLENIKLLDKNNNFVPYGISIVDLKQSCNLDKYRLCSPNFASIFDFNAAKNGGVEYFEVSASYKPYNPYVKIKPHFARLYGINDKDGRGLILQGDFSIPTMSNAWSNFELQNKNYLNTFNREIQSLELQNEIAGTQDVIKALTGTVQGVTNGAMAGGMMGGGYGAIAGAVVGGVSSAIGGAADIYNNARLRNDTIDKARDLFRYNMDNIKALPNTIRNIGCLTTDNLLVPLLEYYTCSGPEREAFMMKMKYYGMSVNRVTQTLIPYLNLSDQTFVKGYLLRLNDVNGVNEEADNHLAEALSDEISKGLYIDISIIPEDEGE